jgi:Fe-S oxidoreductase
MSVFQISATFVLITSLALFASNFGRILQILALGKSRNRLTHIGSRLVILVREVFFHRKLLRQPIPGLIHIAIFWGFLILSLGTLEWFYYGLSGGGHFDFLGEPLYAIFSLSQDLLNFAVFIAVGAAFYRRLIVKPKRMADNSKKSRVDAYFILSLIWLLVLSNLLAHSVAIHNGNDSVAVFKPVASALASLWPSGSLSSSVFYFFWWTHFLIILFFLNVLPFSKHFHVIMSTPNAFFSKTEPRGQLSTLNLEDEALTKFGAERVEEFSWKNLMDSYSCTECGRCNEYCPTATTDKSLRPKSLMISLRAAISEKGPVLLELMQKGGPNEKNLGLLSEDKRALYDKELVPGTYSDQLIWDCTTCGACVEACPVMIDHVDSIVEMRRALVLNKGSNPDEATNAFRNWETASNPWGLNESTRQEYLVEQGVPHYEADAGFEFLYYVGCAGSFDDRNKKVIESVVKILKAAGVKFGILGKEERCNGETARRLGNEYLGQQMIKANKEVLEKYSVKKILTSCPHCFNTLKNEYPEFGGHYEVVHHTDYINHLISEGRLKLDATKMGSVTYHDSCYIGRYNNIYDSPREVLKAVTKTEPIELERSREKGFCCGAGGGRMWLEEKSGSRINENRAQEVIDSKAKTVCVACPFCMTMLTDGMKSKEREDIHVKDIAEIVAEAIS